MLTSLELCAGAGGQAIGFEMAGFEHVALVDNDSHACATLRLNRPYWNVIEADLERFDATYWHGVDVVAAGLPCPPFSIAGKQLGRHDERDLFPSLFKVLSQTQPRAVIVENVRGLLTNRFNDYRNHIEKELAMLGFGAAHWILLDAVNYDVPQFRKRTFLVSFRKDGSFSWPAPDFNIRTVGDSIGDLMASNGWQYAGTWAKKANQPAPTLVGGSKKHGGPDLGPTRARRQWAKLGVDGLGLADTPPPACFQGSPRLTVEMTARIQSFPDDWRLAGTKTHRYRQIGNALPPRLAYAVAQRVSHCLNGSA